MMEDFKRPNHNDFRDSTELEVTEFSGIRHNSITNDCEIWVRGVKARSISKAEVALNPLAISKALEEVFALDVVMPDIPELRKLRGD